MKDILKDFYNLRKHHKYVEVVEMLARKYYYSESYIRKLITKARRVHAND